MATLYLDELNDAQKAPVLHKEGPLMVIAGAGSGKTRVLTYRIAYLMQQGVDPFNILALTFTNKAAREMKSRISGIVGESEAKNLWMGTFHSVFAKILRFEAGKLGYPSNFTIYDTQDAQRLISAVIKEMHLDKDTYKPKQVQHRISSYKNSLITVNAYFNNPELVEADTMAKRPRLGDVYKAYVERCFKAGAMDFDDLLLKTNELLTRFPDVLMKYQDKFRYILVDEYQDTNHSQYLIVRALSDRYQNICVVGDDSQSIYAFRGANINNILNFQRDYENTAVYRLEQNYRSTKNIVQAANSVIEKNKARLEKVIWTANEEGRKIKVHRAITDAEEGRYVAASVFEHKMQYQLTNKDFAVLYRTNSQSRAIEDALRKRDIPYKIYGGLSFYQRKEIKDVLAYLRLVLNPKDEEALVRIINFPARGIGDTTLNKLTVAANHYNQPVFEIIERTDEIDLKINSGIRKKLHDFVVMIKSFQVMNTTADAFTITEHIVKKTGILKAYKDGGTPEDMMRVENIVELINGIKDFVEGQKELADTTGSLAEFLEDVALITDLDRAKNTDDSVSLMTVHLAKGLEFPYVYIVGLEEDLFPSAMNMSTRAELEEERRLFYVALTRAEKQAFLTYTENRYRWGRLIDAEPSRFIEEIDDKYVENPLLSPKAYQYTPLVNADIFSNGSTRTVKQETASGSSKHRKLRKLEPSASQSQNGSANTINDDLIVGSHVTHSRFGKGEVIAIEGRGNDRKAEIKFENGQTKKLLLRFARLTVIR